jgi:hypothetical protein
MKKMIFILMICSINLILGFVDGYTQKCLYVVQTPDPNVSTILNQLGFSVTTSSTIPSNLSAYQLVICRDYSACNTTTANYVGNYIKNGGGAILMGGTPSSFGGGGYSCTNIADWFGTSQYSNVGVSHAKVSMNYPLNTSLVKNDVIEYCRGWGGAAVENVAADATILAMWDYSNGNIHSFIRSYKKGRVAFWAGDAGYNSKNQELFKAICSWTGSSRDIVVNNELSVPDDFILSQNYPNPFNSETTIEYELNKNGIVTLTVYNLLGEKVKKLINYYQPAGKYTIKWDSKNNENETVSSGFYLYSIYFNGIAANRRMFLIK